MKVLIFGSTGRVGKQLVLQALVKKHTVTAFLRNAGNLPFFNERLTKVEGDVITEEDINNVVPGHDAVIVALGQFKHDGAVSLMSTAAKNILWAMKQNGVRRIIGIGDHGILQHDEITLRKNQKDFPTYLQHVSDDHFRVFTRYERSELDWTLVCPNHIPDGGATGIYRLRTNFQPKMGLAIRTGDVAHFMLRELEENKFLQTRVGIAY